jgi:ABC-2 type transport system ATP-binding protein
MMSPPAFALEIKNLKKHYGRHVALEDLNLLVPAGSVMGLVGPNGAGKTTAFAIVAGLLQSDGGTVNVLGKGAFNPIRQKGVLTLLPQDARIPGHSRVRETLIFFGELQGLTKKNAGASADRILEWVDLTDRADAPVSTLSHGMIRRLAAAQAFIGNPELVLLDEPTSGLDPQQVVRIRDLITSLKGRRTIVISSHVLSEIEAACDHIAFIDHGRTTRQDTLDDLVGKQRQLTVFLATAIDHIPAGITGAFPDLTFTIAADGRRLTVSFTDALSPAIINRNLLPALLQAGIDIDEVRRGSNLETVYLEDRMNHQ